MSSFHFSILLRERPPFWKKQRKQKSNSLSFSSPVLFTVKLEWNLPAFLCEEGLCTSSASKSTCDTSPQCDDYCGSVTVCQEFGCTWKLLLFLFFFLLVEDANAPKINGKESWCVPFSPREIRLTVRALWWGCMISLLTPCTTIHVKTRGHNRSIYLRHPKHSSAGDIYL